jgi:hypothetical protein
VIGGATQLAEGESAECRPLIPMLARPTARAAMLDALPTARWRCTAAQNAVKWRRADVLDRPFARFWRFSRLK